MIPREYKLTARIVRDSHLGYLYFMDRAHPLADAKGRVMHHRHVASVKIGRWLTNEEVAHHVDHDRSNNEPGNLEVMTRAEHSAHHAGGATRPVDCKVCGNSFMPQWTTSRYCSNACSGISRRRFDPDAATLRAMVSQMTMVKIGEHFGVSEAAVRKRARKLGVPTRLAARRACVCVVRFHGRML
jgi:hypothetical protein